jgi:hypothetical protein
MIRVCWQGHLTGWQYGWVMVVRTALFVVVLVVLWAIFAVLPWILGCGRIDGPCRVVTRVVPYFGYVGALTGFAFWIADAAVRRLRDARLPALLTGALVLLLLLDAPPIASHAAAGWTRLVGMPVYLLAAVICVIFLCLLPSVRGGERGAKSYGRFAWLALAAVGLLILLGLIERLLGPAVGATGLDLRIAHAATISILGAALGAVLWLWPSAIEGASTAPPLDIKETQSSTPQAQDSERPSDPPPGPRREQAPARARRSSVAPRTTFGKR